MRRRSTSIGVILLACILASPVNALTISSAKIDKGIIIVTGKKSVPLSPITWEGHVVGQSSKTGSFRIVTSIVPSDCAGDVSDGAVIAVAVVKFCGPPGPMGPPGLPGPGMVVKDSAGVTIGPLMLEDAVVISGPDGPVQVTVQGGHFPDHADFAYESVDCSGPGLLPAPNDGEVQGLVEEASDVLNGNLLLRPKSGPIINRLSAGARPSTPEHCANIGFTFVPPDICCCPAGNCGVVSARFGPPRGMIDVSGFVPPFRAELR